MMFKKSFPRALPDSRTIDYTKSPCQSDWESKKWQGSLNYWHCRPRFYLLVKPPHGSFEMKIPTGQLGLQTAPIPARPGPRNTNALYNERSWTNHIKGPEGSECLVHGTWEVPKWILREFQLRVHSYLSIDSEQLDWIMFKLLSFWTLEVFICWPRGALFWTGGFLQSPQLSHWRATHSCLCFLRWFATTCGMAE